MDFEEAMVELHATCRESEFLARLLDLWEDGELDSATCLRLLGTIWCSCEGNAASADSDRLYELLEASSTSADKFDNHIPEMMSEDEREALAALPDMVPIYRGCTFVNIEGFSWTLDRNIAEWFARRFSSPGRPPILRSATVEREFISALKLERNEIEAVLFIQPADHEIQDEVLSALA